jgi:hypothetical protein
MRIEGEGELSPIIVGERNRWESSAFTRRLPAGARSLLTRCRRPTRVSGVWPGQSNLHRQDASAF